MSSLSSRANYVASQLHRVAAGIRAQGCLAAPVTAVVCRGHPRGEDQVVRSRTAARRHVTRRRSGSTAGDLAHPAPGPIAAGEGPGRVGHIAGSSPPVATCKSSAGRAVDVCGREKKSAHLTPPARSISCTRPSLQTPAPTTNHPRASPSGCRGLPTFLPPRSRSLPSCLGTPAATPAVDSRLYSCSL